MTGLLSTLPVDIAARLKLILPELRECKAIAGRFNLERLKAERIAAPSVLVSIIDLKQTPGASGPVHHFDLTLAAYVVTTDQLGIDRDTAAANITQALAGYIPDRKWGSPHVGEARNVRGQSIVTGGFQRAAASLWAVTWNQPAVLDPPDPEAPLDISLYVSQAPAIGADNIGAYEQIGGDQ